MTIEIPTAIMVSSIILTCFSILGSKNEHIYNFCLKCSLLLFSTGIGMFVYTFLKGLT